MNKYNLLSDDALIEIAKREIHKQEFINKYNSPKVDLLYYVFEQRNLLEIWGKMCMDALDDRLEFENQREKLSEINVFDLKIDVSAEKQVRKKLQDTGFEVFDDLQNTTVEDLIRILSSRKIVTLRLQGDSMLNVNLEPDDILFVYTESKPKNGDIVAIRFGSKITVKTWYKKNGSVILKSENDKYGDIPIPPEAEYEIIGVVKHQFKDL